MSSPSSEHIAPINEPSSMELPVAAGAYIEECGARSIGSRHVGLMDPSSITEALEDPTTITASVHGLTMPAFVNLEHAVGAGYEPERCKNMIDADSIADIFYYSLPPVTEEEASSLDTSKLPEHGYVFFDHAVSDYQTEHNLATTLQHGGYEVKELPLDDDKAGEGNEQASISLYAFSNPHADFSKVATTATMAEAYRQGVERGEYAASGNGARLIKGDEINPELADKLWGIYEDRFEWLSEKHPILSEDTKEEFLKLLLAPDTLSSIYFKDDDPTCFAFFTDNMENIYWLNEKFMTGDGLLLQPGERTLFLPGIVARQDGVLGYSAPVIQLATRIIGDNKLPFKTAFENTNRSEVYIPTLVKRYVDRAGYEIDMPQCLDRHMYRCLEITKTAD